ncbi:MAG: phosphoribosylglycinamide formyltransferase [Verrucomicrobia bacterium]|nr:phosphoribosylglycinamide formyltransferase [Verrucomicrobiota bacterium]
MQPLKIAVLGSGKGSNFRAILNAAMAGQLKIQPVLAISDHPEAGLLSLAENLGVATQVVSEPKFRTRLSEEVETGLVEDIRASGAELIVLAGWMRLVKSPMLEAFPRRIINIHPSLLPAFPGLEAWKQALAAGVEKTGCTVHFVDGGMDTGEIISQCEVSILPGDTAETLHARIQDAEHRLFPEVISRFARREIL